MKRRQRIDSATGAVAVMLKAAEQINPPAHAPLDDDALPFWNEIIAAKARSEWTDHELSYASDLANAMAQLVENRRMLRAEGEVLKPEGGKEFANPRVAVVHGLHAQIKSARQSLYIHGRTGKVEDVARRRARAREIEAGSPLADDGEDLLARPPSLQ